MACAVLLALLAWEFASTWREEPVRTELTTHRGLMPDLRFAEYVRTTERMNLGSPAGERLTVEVDQQSGPDAVGVLSRADELPQYAWMVGHRPGFFLDVVEPVDRTLALVLATATDDLQEVTVLLNGHDLGSQRLRRDKKLMTVRMPAPAEAQVRGRNRVQLDFMQVQEQLVEGATQPLPIAARVQTVRFLRPAREAALSTGGDTTPPVRRARVDTAAEDGRQLSALVLPGGTAVGVAVKLPDSERVALRMILIRLDLPLELWASPDGELPQLLLRAEPGESGPGILSVDLSPWVGGYVRLDARVPAGTGDGTGDGAVELRGLALLVPAEGGETGGDEAGSEEDALLEDESVVEELPFHGELEVLRDGPLPLLSWTEDGLCLVVDLASRRRQLFELEQDAGRTRDVSFTRPAAAALLYQELCRAVNAREAAQADRAIADSGAPAADRVPTPWSTLLRSLSLRQ